MSEATASRRVRGGYGPRLVAYAVFAATAGGLLLVAQRLPASRWEPLGAGAFPKLVLSLLLILSLLGLIGEVIKERASLPSFGALARQGRNVAFVLAAQAVYIAALAEVGFSITTFVFLAVVQWRLCRATWSARLTALAVAVVFSFGLAAMFADAFHIYLPRGNLFD